MRQHYCGFPPVAQGSMFDLLAALKTGGDGSTVTTANGTTFTYKTPLADSASRPATYPESANAFSSLGIDNPANLFNNNTGPRVVSTLEGSSR